MLLETSFAGPPLPWYLPSSDTLLLIAGALPIILALLYAFGAAISAAARRREKVRPLLATALVFFSIGALFFAARHVRRHSDGCVMPCDDLGR